MLTKAERDEIRAVVKRGDMELSSTELKIRNSRMFERLPALLDALDAQDAEVARLTAENDRLIVIAKADEWQARYWGEHNAVADREATIMAERAQSAAMRRGREFIKDWFVSLENGLGIDDPLTAMRKRFHAPIHECLDAALQSGAGAKLLADHAAELQGWWDKTKTMAADLAALELYGQHLGPCRRPTEPGHLSKCDCGLESLLQSPDPGKALLDAHAAELAEAKRDTARLFWLETSGAWEWAEWYIGRGIQPDGLGLRAAIDAAMEGK